MTQKTPTLTTTTPKTTVIKSDDQFDEVSVSENEEFQTNEINVKIGENEDGDNEDLQHRLQLLHRSSELTSAQETGDDRVELDADEDIDDVDDDEEEEEEEEDEEAEDEEDADGEDDDDDDDEEEEEVDILNDYDEDSNNNLNSNNNNNKLNSVNSSKIETDLNKIQTDLKPTDLNQNGVESLKNNSQLIAADAESIKLERKLKSEQKRQQTNKKVKQKQQKVSKKSQNEESSKNMNSTTTTTTTEGGVTTVSSKDVKNVMNAKPQSTTIATTVTYARSHMKAPYVDVFLFYFFFVVKIYILTSNKNSKFEK